MYSSPPNIDWKPRYREYAAAIGTAATGAVSATASLILYATELPPLFVPGCLFNWLLAAFLGLAVLVTVLAIGPLESLLRYRRTPRPIHRRLYRWLSRSFWLAWLAWAICLLALLDQAAQGCKTLVRSLNLT
jgi:hypothetical protein